MAKSKVFGRNSRMSWQGTRKHPRKRPQTLALQEPGVIPRDTHEQETDTAIGKRSVSEILNSTSLRFSSYLSSSHLPSLGPCRCQYRQTPSMQSSITIVDIISHAYQKPSNRSKMSHKSRGRLDLVYISNVNNHLDSICDQRILHWLFFFFAIVTGADDPPAAAPPLELLACRPIPTLSSTTVSIAVSKISCTPFISLLLHSM